MIVRPEAPAEKSPLIALTPECSPLTRLDQHAVVDVGDQRILIAIARQQLQGQAPHAGSALEPAANRVAGALRTDATSRVRRVDEPLQHAAIDQHVAAGGEALAVEIGRGVRLRVRRIVDERDDRRWPRSRRAGP